MKKAYVILLVLILIRPVASQAYGLVIQHVDTHQCCSAQDFSSQESEEQEETHDCCDSSCHCTCCVHLLSFTPITTLNFATQDVLSTVLFGYLDNYYLSYIDSDLDPPRHV